MNNREFINSIAPGAIKAYKNYGVLPSLTIAQACLESNYGRSAPGYNLFGIKWSEGCGRASQDLLTSEYLDGKWIKVTAKFRAYNSYAESIDDHGKFLVNNSRYKPVLEATDYKSACIRIQACGYATDPNYSTQLINIVEQYALNKYDEVVKMTWKEILEKVSANPTDWENAITTAANAANADGNLGALEIFKYLPALIEKIYNSRD